MAGGVWQQIAEIEEQFNHTTAKTVMKNNWHFSIYISVFYVLTIFGIQRYMRDRPKYTLRGQLMAWSSLLAVFSLTGFYITGTRHWHYAFVNGWKSGVCDPILVEKQAGLWAFFFCLSKCPELVDTYFIVLRKQKLIFLHWYHHISVFIYCWYNYGYMTMPQQWFITMNYFVHSIMYTYYSIRASGCYRPPLYISMVITSFQLLQMAVGVWVNLYVFINMSLDRSWYCDGMVEKTYFFVYAAFIMYASYFFLFAHFFYTSYINRKERPKEKDVPVVSSNGTVNGTKTHQVITQDQRNGVVKLHQTTAIQRRPLNSH